MRRGISKCGNNRQTHYLVPMKIYHILIFAACGLWACGSSGGDAATENGGNAANGEAYAGDLPCDTAELRMMLKADPLYQEAMDLENPFYRFMQETDSLTFERLNDEFLAIYEESAMEKEPCSQEYLDAFKDAEDVLHFATILCDQMNLNQAIKDKYPCIMELSEDARSAVLDL
jgi:hypothetical protein